MTFGDLQDRVILALLRDPVREYDLAAAAGITDWETRVALKRLARRGHIGATGNEYYLTAEGREAFADRVATRLVGGTD